MPSSYNIVLKKSECGGYLSFHEPGSFSVIVIPPTESHAEGLAVSIFGSKQVWSNFLCNTGVFWTINGESVSFKNAEQVFKAACVIAHMDPDDETTPTAGVLLDVLAAVMSAKSPAECKAASNAIPKGYFDAAKWDSMSFYPMVKAQELKCTGDVYYENMQMIGSLAKNYGVKRCYFAEAIGDRDNRWGTGLTVDDMTQAVIDHVRDPVWLNMGLGTVLPFPGKNLMGEALTAASRVVLGKDFEFVGASLDDYIVRIGTVCPLFSYVATESTSLELEEGASVTKRARTSGFVTAVTAPEEEEGFVTAEWIERTVSDEVSSGNDSPVEGRHSLAGMSQPYDLTGDDDE